MGVVALGVNKGIEVAGTILMPLLFLLILALTVYTLTLSGSAKGIKFYLKPDLSKLAGTTTWSSALGQAFLSVGVGMGIIVTYGSHVAKNIDLPISLCG